MKQSTKEKLEIKGRRVFSETLKKQLIKDLVSKRVSVHQLMREHQVSSTTVYRWLYKYSPFHERKCTLVVQMESEATINSDLQKRIAVLERAVGQKQLEIDFLNKLFEVGSAELGFDLKKNFSTQPSNGSDVTKLKGAS
jgi:transposase-like protein